MDFQEQVLRQITFTSTRTKRVILSGFTALLLDDFEIRKTTASTRRSFLKFLVLQFMYSKRQLRGCQSR